MIKLSQIERFEKLVVLTAATALFTFILVNRILIVGDHNTDIEGIEQTFVHAVQQKLATGRIYHNPELPPYLVFQYSPLYFDMVAKFVGSADEMRQIYITGRLINLLSNLAVSALIFAFAYKIFSLSFYWSVTLGLLTFTLFFSHNYAFRPDSIKTLCAILSLYSVFAYIKHPSFFLLLVMSFAAGIAFFFKQDGLLYPCLVLLVLLYYRKVKAAFIFSCMAGLLFSGLLMFYLFEYGVDFYENVFRGLRQGLQPSWFLMIIRNFWNDLFLLVLSLLSLFLLGTTGQRKVHTQPLIICLILILIVNLIALNKWGSTFVYLMEAFLLSLLLAFVALKNHKFGAATMSLTRITFVIIFVLVTSFSFYGKSMNRYSYSKSKDSEFADQMRVKEEVAKSVQLRLSSPNNRLLCFDKDLCNLLWDCCVFGTFEAEYPYFLSCDFEFPSQPNKIFDYVDIYRQIEAGRIELLVSRNCGQIEQLFPPEKLQFQLVDSIHGYLIYQNQHSINH